ncbi:MAG: hypothetical protein ABIT37_23465 [Luteolibacter sp.]
MKSTPIPCGAGGISAALFAAFSLTCPAQTVSVDGIRDDPEGYTLLHTQVTPSNWGSPNRCLANLYAKQEGGSLFLHLASKANDGAVIIFLDTKPGGVSFIANNLITSGGEGEFINRLGTSPTAGLTFETGFNPDYAVRIYGNGGDAYVNIYNLTTGVRSYAGNSGTAPASSGIIQDMKTAWGDFVLADYATASLGVEMKLGLASMGVPFGVGTVKATAIMVDAGSNYASNQVLGSRTSATGDIGGGINSFNFETEAGTQTLSFAVNNNDTDGDGLTNDVDTDDDNDGLLDTAETNTGIYVSPTNTGTNPLVVDSDGDGVTDSDEVNGNLGYLSDPNKPNYNSMAVPGNFTTPQWKEDGSAGNTMVQGNTASLITQYDWTLDYKFTVIGAIAYKYAANGSWTVNWGNGSNDFTATIPAKGFYRFAFNNVTLVQSVTRTAFPDVTAYLAAYGLTTGPDSDGDGVSNEAEFVKNTDPTSADTDGDGSNDLVDANPLVAGGYNVWATTNAGGQGSGSDFDGDGVKNGVEYFMGQTGSTFTANPSLVAGTVTWPKDPAFSGTYEVQTSPDLVTWTNVSPRPTPTPQNTIAYTPTGTGKVFVRLQVIAPAP